MPTSTPMPAPTPTARVLTDPCWSCRNYFGASWSAEPLRAEQPYRVRLILTNISALERIRIRIFSELPTSHWLSVSWQPPLAEDPFVDPTAGVEADALKRYPTQIALFATLLPAGVAAETSFEIARETSPGSAIYVVITAAYAGWPDDLNYTDRYSWMVPAPFAHEDFFSGERGRQWDANGHETATSWVHSGIYSRWHSPAISLAGGFHSAATDQRHDAFYSDARDIETGWIHDATYSRWHSPETTLQSFGAHDSPTSYYPGAVSFAEIWSHDAYLSRRHETQTSVTHDGVWSKSHEPTESRIEGNASTVLGHGDFFSWHHAAQDSMIHDGAYSRLHDSPTSGGDDHSSSQSLGHDAFYSARHLVASSNIHDVTGSGVHYSDRSRDAHFGPWSNDGHSEAGSVLGHVAACSKRHNVYTSGVPAQPC